MNTKLGYVFSIIIGLFIHINLHAQINIHAQKKSKIEALKKIEIVKLVKNLKGNYTNINQTEADSNYQLANLSIISVWPSNQNSEWIYVEIKTKSTKFDSCFKHLFQVFMANDSLLIFQEYELPANFNKFIFEKNNFDQMANHQLNQKIGCAIFFMKDLNGNYKGQTHSTDCGSARNGASYETFYVNLNSNEINWWNSGYDSLGNYICGNTKGGYIFNKTNK